MLKEIALGHRVTPTGLYLISTAYQGKRNVQFAFRALGISDEPPLLVIGIQDKNFSREMIQKSGEFVINVCSEKQLFAVDKGRDFTGRTVEDKFVALGLETLLAKQVQAPLVAGCHANVECKLINEMEVEGLYCSLGRRWPLISTIKCYPSPGSPEEPFTSMGRSSKIAFRRRTAMFRRLLTSLRVLAIPTAVIIHHSNLHAATPEETLAKINRLPPAERQATLVKEAKNERTVVWYAPMNREDLRQFTSAFQTEYPFLKVEVLTGGPQSLLNRILTEHRSGRYNYDTLNIRSSALYTLKKANAISRYDTPYRRGLRSGFYDKDGYFSGIWASLMVYLFNTHQVTRAQAPRSIADLLQPKWKGKLGLDQDADDWLAALLEYYGDEKGKQIARSLGAQQLNIRKGRTLVSQLVAAGEFPVQIDAHHHEAVALRQAGAPVDYFFPEPFVPVKSVSAFVMSSQPPHPHAAALLVDFMLSKKGQEIAFRQRRWPAFKELATGGPDDIGTRNTLIPDAEKWGSRYEELVQLTKLLER